VHGKQVNQSSDELRVTPSCALPRDRASAPRGQTHASTQQRSHPPRSVWHSLGVAPKQAVCAANEGVNARGGFGTDRREPHRTTH